MSKQQNNPAPGSEAARKAGCTCPVIDNGYGRGRGDGNYIMVEGCPVHSTPRDNKDVTR